jgi:hypothetical protein
MKIKTLLTAFASLIIASTAKAGVNLFPDSDHHEMKSPSPTAENNLRPAGDTTPTPKLAAPSKYKPRKVTFKAEDGVEDCGKLEQSMAKKAVQQIRWSGNPTPKEAADEDFTAIFDYCGKTKIDMVATLITIATEDGNHPGEREYTSEMDDVSLGCEKNEHGWQHFDEQGKLIAAVQSEDTGYELDEHPPSGVDKPGSLYNWTERYIEQASSFGFGKLINPQVSGGPWRTTHNGQPCWLIKAVFHVPGDNNEHSAVVYVTDQVGPNHVIDCKIDF